MWVTLEEFNYTPFHFRDFLVFPWRHNRFPIADQYTLKHSHFPSHLHLVLKWRSECQGKQPTCTEMTQPATLACGKLIIMSIDNHREDLRRVTLAFPEADTSRASLLFCPFPSTDMRPKAESQGEGLDGGYGWVLVGALFVSTSLVFGLMRSLGIFFVEFVQYFDESAQAISWISSTGLAAQQFFSEFNWAFMVCNWLMITLLTWSKCWNIVKYIYLRIK